MVERHLSFLYGELYCIDSISDYGLSATEEIYVSYLYGVHGKVENVAFIGVREMELMYTYDHKDRLTRYAVRCERTVMIYEYEYGTVGGAYPDDKLHVVKLPDEQTVTYGYDEMQRMKTRTIGNISETYEYLSLDESESGHTGGCTTNLVSQIQYSSAGFAATATYVYSARGNIMQATDYSQTVSYKYDGLNRLIRENNQKLGFTATYAYDDMGNIIEKKVHPYTTPGNTPLVAKQTYTFTYGTSGADTNRLLSVTKKILSSTTTYNISSYDLLGNPCNYRGNVLQWGRGRNLMRFGNHTYRYNANGIRMEKTTADGVVHKYWYEGDRLYRELRGTTEILYYYDGTGIEGFSVGGVRYHYQKNAQGDIVRIFNDNGSLAAQYFYNAWGEHSVYDASGTANTNATFIGNINPFRYRGYYFDAETGLYYLQSRYYDPQYGRFINADDISYLDPEDLTGGNLYAYCGNNPVMYYDPSGHFLISTAILIGVAIGAAIGFGAAAYIDYKDDGQLFNGSVKWYDYLGATVLGGAIGAAVGYGIGYLAGGTYANGLAAKSVSAGVKNFISQANKVNHVLGKAGHNLTGYTAKSMGSLMKNTLKKGVVGVYKNVESAYWQVMGSEVTFAIVDGLIRISDMWIR